MLPSLIAGFPPPPNYDKNKSHPPPPLPVHQSHCARSTGGYITGGYGSKSPSSGRYGNSHEQQQQHQSRRKPVRDQQHQMRDHASLSSGPRGGGYPGGYHREQQIEVHRAPEGNRGRHIQPRSLSATRGSGGKNNQYHHSASWVSNFLYTMI